MKHFIFYLVKLIIIVTIFLFVLEEVYTRSFLAGTSRSKVQQVLNLEEDAYYDYVFFGSSRTENTIDCPAIEALTGCTCLNLGISGSSIQDDYILLKLLTQERVPFGQAFMQVDYAYNYEGISPAFKAEILPYEFHPTIEEALKEVEDVELLKTIPFYRYMVHDKIIGFREMVNQLTGRRSKIEKSNGYWPKEGTTKKIAGSFPNEITANNIYLDKMIELLKEHKQKIHLFTAPYCPGIKNREGYMENLTAQLPGLQNYVAIFDNHRDYYYDCGHVNKEGARIFSEKLIRDFQTYNNIKNCT